MFKVYQLSAFTVIELMLSLLLASLLTTTLVTVYLHTKRRYQVVMTLATMLDDEHYGMYFLRHKISAADNIKIYKHDNLPELLQRQLKPLSDVLIVINNDVKEAYYVARVSWHQRGKLIDALFSKQLGGQRQELLPNVVNLMIKPGTRPAKGVDFAIVVKSNQPILEQPLSYTIYAKKIFPVDRYLYRVWYGYAA